jgi:hypothetical protein
MLLSQDFIAARPSGDKVLARAAAAAFARAQCNWSAIFVPN